MCAAMPARLVAALFDALAAESARLRSRLPSMGLSPMAQGQVRVVLARLDAETAADESRRGPLDGYLAARLQERLDFMRALPTLIASVQARAELPTDDDGLWLDEVTSTHLAPLAPQVHHPSH